MASAGSSPSSGTSLMAPTRICTGKEAS
jgi:hypothetical protein